MCYVVGLSVPLAFSVSEPWLHGRSAHIDELLRALKDNWTADLLLFKFYRQSPSILKLRINRKTLYPLDIYMTLLLSIISWRRTWKWLVAICREFLKATGALTTLTPTAAGPVDTREIDEGMAWKVGTGTATTDGTPTPFPDASRDGRETFRCPSLAGGRGLKGGTVTTEALFMACDMKKAWSLQL
jgi:hypothetical protein